MTEKGAVWEKKGLFDPLMIPLATSLIYESRCPQKGQAKAFPYFESELSIAQLAFSAPEKGPRVG
jgi:hypothetical protein